MRSKQIEVYKETLKLSRKQRSIIVGTLLGDGHFETQNKGKTYRLKIEHSSKQSFYTDWLYDQFLQWVNTPPKTKPKLLGNKCLQNYGFQTLSVGQFRFYANQFYDKGIKHVPRRIAKWLDPLALAVWFMDDGSSKSKYHKALILNTHSFSKSDINLLRKAFEDRYSIESTIRKQSDGLQILIVGINAEKFYKIIQPYMLPDFNYKFGALVNTIA